MPLISNHIIYMISRHNGINAKYQSIFKKPFDKKDCFHIIIIPEMQNFCKFKVQLCNKLNIIC